MKALLRLSAFIIALMTLTTLLFGCGTTAAQDKNAPTTDVNAAEAKKDPVAATAAETGEATAKSNWPDKLVMGFLPGEESTPDAKASNAIHQKALTDYLGIPVEVIICEDYNAVVETMRTGKTHLASFGPFSYILAHDRSNAEAIVVNCKEGKKENAFYSSVFITNPSSGIKTLADLKGKSFAFVDPASTSGNLVPRAMFVKEFNVTPEEIDTKIFKSTQFSGSHNNSLLAVANKSVDAAACTRLTYETGIAKNTVKDTDVVIFAESDPIPNSPIAVRGDLPADLKAKIKEFYLQWQDPEYQKLRNIVGYKFMEINDSDYDAIRTIAAQMNMKPEDLSK